MTLSDLKTQPPAFGQAKVSAFWLVFIFEK
jgi:hypothetical protein